jgi:hypothetical protein
MKALISLITLTWLCCLPALHAQDPELQDEADTLSGLEYAIRTGDWPGERPVDGRRSRNGVRRVSVPRGAARVGCICMDDTPNATRSIGACSGHGGVRYWLYRTVEGDTVRVVTGRHERHPGPLTEAERSALVQRRAERTARLLAPVAYGPSTPVVIVSPNALTPAPPPPADAGDPLGWPDVAGAAVAGGALAYSIRILLRWMSANPVLAHHALRYLLRYRRRSATRKNRAPARKTRL